MSALLMATGSSVLAPALAYAASMWNEGLDEAPPFELSSAGGSSGSAVLAVVAVGGWTGGRLPSPPRHAQPAFPSCHELAAAGLISHTQMGLNRAPMNEWDGTFPCILS